MKRLKTYKIAFSMPELAALQHLAKQKRKGLPVEKYCALILREFQKPVKLEIETREPREIVLKIRPVMNTGKIRAAASFLRTTPEELIYNFLADYARKRVITLELLPNGETEELF